MRACLRPILRTVLSAVASLLLGCGDATVTPTEDAGPKPYEPPPASVVVEEGAITIRREVVLVPGVDVPGTPAELAFVRLVRYRVDADPPRPARAIAVLMPGFLGGAGSFDPLARAIVRASNESEAFEAWAIDRRANLLEDHHGLDVAEVRKDPELALAYYFDGAEVEGKTFAGFVGQGELPYLAEDGLATTVGDLHNVIALVAPEERRARVVLVGHSLGASIAEEYAAWDFDGTPGYSELAGLVLVDGVARSEGAATPPITEAEYLAGSMGGPAGFNPPGLDAIESSTPYIALPLLGVKIYAIAAISAMRALWSPEAITVDPVRDQAFMTLLSLPSVPDMTNRAAMGLAFDDESNGVSFAAVSCGTSAGGPTEKYTSILGPELTHPSDPDATYTWVEFDAVDPPEHTALDDLARSWHEGPGLDFGEWYFPARLSLDAPAAASLVLEPGDWPLDEYGLRAVHGAEMDLPIFGAVAGLVATTDALDALRALVDPVPIGAGRPLAGEPRSHPDAFKELDISELTHIDPLSGSPESVSVAGWHAALVGWMRTNTPEGGVSVVVGGGGG